MKTKSKKSESEQAESDHKKHLERLEILAKSKEIKGRQLTVSGLDGTLKELDELRDLIQNKMDDPQQKWDLYYNGIRNILVKYLPGGTDFKEQRQWIYDEKNIFLTRGHPKYNTCRRGADSRMGYNPAMKEIVEIIAAWIMGSRDMISLYDSIYRLNDKFNYGHQSYDESSKAFHKGMG